MDAAQVVFLREGYLATSMDEVAALSQVSKQTIYKHFENKEKLFEIVMGMTSRAGDAVQVEMSGEDMTHDVQAYLREYAFAQLTVVLTPRLMQLRRLVIAEVTRFPELARVLHESGPTRAIAQLSATFKILADRGLLSIDDPALAASAFNWLVMSEPLNQAMLLDDKAIPGEQQLRQYADQGVRVFLAAYSTR